MKGIPSPPLSEKRGLRQLIEGADAMPQTPLAHGAAQGSGIGSA
jgi:hypothetical protein